MTQPQPIRWGILSTANIAKRSFLPGLHAAGGVAEAVGGRDLDRTRDFAEKNGIHRALDGYAALIDDPNIDAIYNPLPNSLHAEWTIAALHAGKAVLCEKPLTAILAETQDVLRVARETGTLLWEAFVFPFREQTQQLLTMLRDGRIGDVREVQAEFHFDLPDHSNIRYAPELGGGGLFDVGCYCIRFGRIVFDAETDGGVAAATWAPEGVDVDLQGILNFPGDRRVVISCGMSRQGIGSPARVIGTEGEITLTNPYHPNGHDLLQVIDLNRDLREEIQADDVASFGPAISHIQQVLREEESPRHLAVDEALGNALAIDVLERSAKSGEYELPQAE